MRRRGGRARARLGVAAAVTLGMLVALPLAARADTPPSVWDRARDPALDETYRIHVEVQRRLAQRGRFDVGESQTLAARAILERAGAERSPDVRLRFDLGAVHLLLRDHGRAAEVLKAALADAPEHPAADEAWIRLAFACGHLGDHACERSAYLEVLRRSTEELGRATPTLNLAETEMHLGNLKEAIAGYREALRIAGRMPTRETAPLAVWGLAVALDRSGDRPAAEAQAKFALELERSMGMRNLLRSTDVFFVPDYEVLWYEALGASARARAASTAAEAARQWSVAERCFSEYVRAGEAGKEKDRWLDVAKARLAAVKVERERADKRRARSRVPLEEGEDVTL